MPERDDLDLLIESALADYAEPRAGLEQRMLARISGKVENSSPRRWLFVASAPAAAVLILLGYLMVRTPHSQPGQMADHPAIPSVAPVIPPATSRPTGKSATIRRVRHKESAADRASNNQVLRPKLDVFPTPQPLNAEEQAMSKFVAQSSDADRKALVEAQQRIDEPLKISAIRIAPIQSPEGNQN